MSLPQSVEEVIVYPASHDVVLDATIECNTADIGYLDIGAVEMEIFSLGVH